MELNGRETYVSVDVETTGDVPGLYSMIDLGACVVGDLENCFSASLKEDPKAGRSVSTMRWWMSTDHKRRVLSAIQERAEDPTVVMWRFRDWLAQFARPVFVAFPAGFDFPFIRYYWFRWIGNTVPPFGHQCVDGKTIAALKLGCEYKHASKDFMHKKFPQGFRRDLPHSHFAVDDAKEQAVLFEELIKL